MKALKKMYGKKVSKDVLEGILTKMGAGKE